MELPVDATLGEKIRFYRQQAGLTQVPGIHGRFSKIGLR